MYLQNQQRQQQIKKINKQEYKDLIITCTKHHPNNRPDSLTVLQTFGEWKKNFRPSHVEQINRGIFINCFTYLVE